MPAWLSNPFAQVLIGALVGGAVTWFFAWWYYKRAGDDLRAEAKALHVATGAIVYFLENPNAQITAQRDDQGRVTGLLVSAAGLSQSSLRAQGRLTDASANRE
jgi:hypothetical protein